MNKIFKQFVFVSLAIAILMIGGLAIYSATASGGLKINPILDWTQDELERYLVEHDLPNEHTYYDPAKGDEKHECGLHAKLTTEIN